MKIAKMSVEYMDSMGTDLSVCTAARVSFDKESEWEEEVEFKNGIPVVVKRDLSAADKKLINYLAKHNHWSPFAHTSVSFRVKAPIFVARQLVKHTVGFSWNEVSRRYVDSEPEFFMPDLWRKKADNVKQGSSSETIKPQTVKGKCGNCGSSFTPKSNNQKFCSTNCQASDYRDRFPTETKWTRWKSSAKARGLDFTITEDDLEWPRYCPYLGIELTYHSNNKEDNVASLDRIDSTKGYVPGNVQIVSTLANIMKNDASIPNLVSFARSVLAIHQGIVVPDSSGVEQVYEQALTVYNNMIEQGVCAEQARMFLPQGAMTEWIWTGSVYAFARMCNLRLDSHTQAETREIAQMVSDHMASLYPISWKALMNDSSSN